jgi:D-glycero-D-manno-heptose 1,7-bisphosphate phosphatase
LIGKLPPAAVFLDRDGTLIEDRDYLDDPAGVELLPGVNEWLPRLRDAGYLLVVVTNQSGIGRGYFTKEDYLRVTERMVEALPVPLDGIYYCPHAPEQSCECRKPAPDLLFRAAAELGVELAASWMIGDTERDVLAGLNAGCRAVLIGDGPAPTGVPVAAGFASAVRIILGSVR